jgi:hypothetical protein
MFTLLLLLASASAADQPGDAPAAPCEWVLALREAGAPLPRRVELPASTLVEPSIRRDCDNMLLADRAADDTMRAECARRGEMAEDPIVNCTNGRRCRLSQATVLTGRRWRCPNDDHTRVYETAGRCEYCNKPLEEKELPLGYTC